MSAPVSWLSQFAAAKGFRYEPEADDRWIRVWEPFATLKVPIRYEHALLATGASGSLTIARLVVNVEGPAHDEAVREASAWVAIAQDERITARAAATSDPSRVFGDPLDLVPMPRRRTKDPAFDGAFAAFAPTEDDLARAITPSVRKLVTSWRAPLHFEVRKGGFILAPVALGADPRSLAWFVDAVHTFGEKAAKGAA